MEQSIKKQYPGLYILKPIAMFLVIVLHIVGAGGAGHLSSSPKLTVWLLNSIEMICYCCINLFAMATGFIYYGRKRKLSKLLSFWVQVLFYSVLGAAAFFLITRSFASVKPYIVSMVLPFTFNHYWYFTFYVFVYLLIPLLNAAVDKMNKNHFALLFITVLFVTLTDMFTGADLLLMKDGYSPIWLFILYIIGAYIKKYDLNEKKLNPVIVWFGMAVMGLSVIVTLLFGNLFLPFKKAMYSYTNFPVIIFSIIVFLLFLKIGAGKQCSKFVKTISASSFTVYLIHTHIIIFNNYIRDNFSWIGQKNAILAVALVFLCAAGIYIVCTALGLAQMQLFKWLKIDGISERIVDSLKKIFFKAENKLTGDIDK